MSAGLRANYGQPWGAKVRGLPRGIHGMAARPPDPFASEKKQRKEDYHEKDE